MQQQRNFLLNVIVLRKSYCFRSVKASIYFAFKHRLSTFYLSSGFSCLILDKDTN